MPALRTKTIIKGDTTWTYQIFKATPKKWLCQTSMEGGDCNALWQTLKGGAATRLWWKEKTGQDFYGFCPKGDDHNWQDVTELSDPPDSRKIMCVKCGEPKTERR